MTDNIKELGGSIQYDWVPCYSCQFRESCQIFILLEMKAHVKEPETGCWHITLPSKGTNV